MSSHKTELANGSEISYKAYVRNFGTSTEDADVIYGLASAVYPTGGYELFFKQTYGGGWELWQNTPSKASQLVTYYVASGTSSQPLLEPPAEVQITDAQGTHSVTVQNW